MIALMTGDAWHEAAEGVFRKRFDPCNVTVTAVVGSQGVAVVDTRCSLAEAREVKEQIRRLTAAPIRWVVNTHAHFDHTWGNAEFAAPRLVPPARIWAHESVPGKLDRDDPAVAAFLDRLSAEGPEWAAKVAELEFARPTETVGRLATIDLGDRGLELRFLGRGHTDGDLWIRVLGPGTGTGAGREAEAGAFAGIARRRPGGGIRPAGIRAGLLPAGVGSNTGARAGADRGACLSDPWARRAGGQRVHPRAACRDRLPGSRDPPPARGRRQGGGRARRKQLAVPA